MVNKSINLEKVSLKIPIYNENNLPKTFKNNFIGGKLIRENKSLTNVLALDKISYTVNEGDRLGVLGHNGAGKTSFLKVISGIYLPTSGKFSSNLNIFPLISKSFFTPPSASGYVASKAHYLMFNENENGLDEFIEEVKVFSEVGDYFYLPIKTYSPGMRTRLLFTLLTSLSAECLVIDEGLGAGDKKFREMAQFKFNNMIKNTGTLVFASHNSKLLKDLCSKGIVLNKGKIVFEGDISSAINFYEGGNDINYNQKKVNSIDDIVK